MVGEAITYSLRGVDEKEEFLLNSMIERIARRLDRPVMCGPIESAHIIFFDGPTPERHKPSSRLVRLIRNGDAQRALGTVRIPPHVTELQSVFSDFLGEKSHAQTDCSLVKRLAGSIYDLCKLRGDPHALVDGAGRGLILYPGERQFSWSGQEEDMPIADFFRPRGLLDFNLRPLADGAPSEIGARRGIEPVLWHMGLAHAQCGLLSWVSADNILKLRVWPYLATQGPRASTRLATLLRAQPRSVTALVATADVPEQDVIAFVNAALLCGFLAGETRSDARVAPSPPIAQEDMAMPVRAAAFSGVFGAIRNALRMRT